MSNPLEERDERVSAMAGRCGADVAEAFRQGVIGPRQYRRFLARCTGCKAADACQNLLRQLQGDLREGDLREGDLREGDLGAAPEYCENKAEIAALKDRLQRALT